jgi:hypothetical protein
VSAHPAYETYWKRKSLLKQSFPSFPVRRWWETDGLCEIERVYFDAIRDTTSLLDVGAGDLRVMRKLQAAGYRGEYHTQDIGDGGPYTYADLTEVRRLYGAILCLDVLEHLPLTQGISLLQRMLALLAPGGALVLQTPNAAYLPDPRSWDMTHVHTYAIHDLWAFFVCEGLDVAAYRVVLGPEREGFVAGARSALQRWAKRKLLGCDFANNTAIIARKRA